MIDTISYVKTYYVYIQSLMNFSFLQPIWTSFSHWVFPRCRRHKRFVPAELLRHRVAAGAQQTQHVQATLLHLRILEGTG